MDFPVTDFAKKTGDFGSLSTVDMKLMALTYQLACEQEPEKAADLRKAPYKEVTFEIITSIIIRPLFFFSSSGTWRRKG